MKDSVLNQDDQVSDQNLCDADDNDFLDGESDIVEDDDLQANAQRPFQDSQISARAPGDRIETSNNRADQQNGEG